VTIKTTTITRTELLCDLDGGRGDVRTVPLTPGWSGDMEMKLCAAHRVRLAADLAPFIAAARKVNGTTAPGRRRTADSRRQAASIRAWAVAQGLAEPGRRGRIPAELVRRYQAAQNGGAR
jgi:hypothetical protein